MLSFLLGLRNTVRAIEEKVKNYISNVSFGPTKSAFRIRQKIDEYQLQWPLPDRLRALSMMKDLFRGAVHIDHFNAQLDRGLLGNQEFTHSIWRCELKKTKYDYSALYLVIDVDDHMFELQVLTTDPRKLQESHLWYELSRSEGRENLEKTIKNAIFKLDNVRQEAVHPFSRFVPASCYNC